MLSFNNTEVAFSGKTKNDLNRSYWLFKMVSNSGFVKLGKSLTTFAINAHLPIKKMIKATIFKQFCGGETIDECDKTIAELGKFNIGTILDYSVEGKETEKDFDACTAETIATITKAKNSNYIPFCVFKVTGLARFELLEKVSASYNTLTPEEQKEYGRVQLRVNTICKAAHDAGIPIFIDAEESWIQQAIDNLANQMMILYNTEKAIVYNTYQLYRKDRLAYLKHTFQLASESKYYLGAKLVRGAYMEKERARAAEKGYPSPIHDTKQNTDTDYDAAVLFSIEHADRIAICAGTHNENSSMKLAELMQQKNINPQDKHIYFSQLLGMSDHISYNLANAGYNVAKYVPYGPVREVLPYLIRRAQENTSVKGQTGRELSLIIKEKERRSKN
ncbi:MAG TPA: proline dehydrogenase family protein [Bacteroidia bacterium]|jgi:proline dehydrogenase|nr:proline dehydrogenase family protein [Bacteroidia bacterium]